MAHNYHGGQCERNFIYVSLSVLATARVRAHTRMHVLSLSLSLCYNEQFCNQTISYPTRQPSILRTD